jgi:hypothetical protein
MTLSDAAGLAILALHDRRLVAAILRALRGRATADDADALPPRHPDEPVLDCACRVRGTAECDVRRVRAEADQQIRRATDAGVQPLALGDRRYPPLLAAITEPPAVLWVRGATDALSLP